MHLHSIPHLSDLTADDRLFLDHGLARMNKQKSNLDESEKNRFKSFSFEHISSPQNTLFRFLKVSI